MLKGAVDLGRQVLSLTRDVQDGKAGIKKMQDEIDGLRSDNVAMRQEFTALARIVEQLALKLQHHEATAERDRRIQQLEIENRFLRGERRLPPDESDDKEA